MQNLLPRGPVSVSQCSLIPSNMRREIWKKQTSVLLHLFNSLGQGTWPSIPNYTEPSHTTLKLQQSHFSTRLSLPVPPSAAAPKDVKPSRLVSSHMLSMKPKKDHAGAVKITPRADLGRSPRLRRPNYILTSGSPGLQCTSLQLSPNTVWSEAKLRDRLCCCCKY